MITQFAQDLDNSPAIRRVTIYCAVQPANWQTFDPLRDVAQRAMINNSSFLVAQQLQKDIENVMQRTNIQFRILNQVGGTANGINFGPGAPNMPKVQFQLFTQ